MARKKFKLNPGHVVAGVATVVGAGGLLYYVLAGAGSEKNAGLIPDAIEVKLDRVVDKLKEEFGETWVQQGLSALETALAKLLPAPLVALVSAVYRAEQWGNEHFAATGRKVSGHEKRCYAAQLCVATT